VRFALVQIYEERCLDALPYLKSALEKEVDVVLLPEKWTPKTDENVIKNGESAFLKLLERLSEEYSAVLVSGALYEDFSNKKFLSSYVFQEGKLVGVARKIHPFMNEKHEVEAGEELLLFDYKGVKLGLLICYDLDFPETVRLFALKGCDMLLVPAKVVKQAIEAWLIYVQARVLENRLPLAYANVFQPPFFNGKSALVDMKTEDSSVIVLPRIQIATEEKGVYIFETHAEQFRELRKKRLSDRNLKVDRLFKE